MNRNKKAFILGMYSAFNGFDALEKSNNNVHDKSLIANPEPPSVKRIQYERNKVLIKIRKKHKKGG